MNKFTVLLLFCTILSACSNSTDDVEKNSEMETTLTALQNEVRLLTKEVVGLRGELADLSKKRDEAQKPGLNTVSAVSIDGEIYASPRLGSEQAKFAMIEFSDYQCPYCMRYSRQVFPTIKERYVDTGELQYIVRNFPLSFHSKAKGAGVAASCAANQSKFWEMNEGLINNARKLGNELYLKLSADIGLNQKTFQECLSDPKSLQHVNNDIDYGASIGVNGTPRFFIGRIEGNKLVNVKSVSGSRPVDFFDRAIREVLYSD